MCEPYAMNAMPPDKPLLNTLRGKIAARPPFWLMRQAGRYLPEYRALRARANGFMAFCRTPALAAEATLQPIRRFAMDGAIVFSDILVVPEALGVSVKFIEGEGPRLESVSSAADISHLRLEGLTHRLAPVYETLTRVRTALADDAPQTTLIGFAGAPWTLAAYMVEGRGSRDFMRARRWAYAEPESFAQLVTILEQSVAAHLIAQIRAGAEAVQLFDSWAGVLAPDQFSRWCTEPAARIAAAVHAACPQAPIIGFPRGAGHALADYAAASCVDAVSLDTSAPMAHAQSVLPAGMTVQGNLDPALLLVGGQAMAAAVAALRQVVGARPWVFNLGHGVLPETPPAHIAFLAELLRSETAVTPA